MRNLFKLEKKLKEKYLQKLRNFLNRKKIIINRQESVVFGIVITYESNMKVIVIEIKTYQLMNI